MQYTSEKLEELCIKEWGMGGMFNNVIDCYQYGQTEPKWITINEFRFWANEFRFGDDTRPNNNSLTISLVEDDETTDLAFINLEDIWKIRIDDGGWK